MKYTVFIIGLCFFVLSCKKDSNNSAENKTQLLTSADWKYDDGGIGDANGNILFNFSTLGIIPACTLDNSVRFNSDHSGTIYENGNICPNGTSTSTFTWSFSSNETVLNVSAGAVAGIGGSFKINTLSDTRLTLLKDTTISGFGSVTAVVHLKH